MSPNWLSLIRLSGSLSIRLSPSLASGAQLSGRYPMRPPVLQNMLVSLHAYLHACPFICLPVWLVVSGSLNVYVSLHCTCLPSFVAVLSLDGVIGCPVLFTCPRSLVSQCGQCCSALWTYLFTCFPLLVSQSGWCPALWTSLHLCPFICLPLCLVVSCSSDVFSLFSLVYHQVSLAMCLPSFLSPN